MFEAVAKLPLGTNVLIKTLRVYCKRNDTYMYHGYLCKENNIFLVEIYSRKMFPRSIPTYKLVTYGRVYHAMLFVREYVIYI